MRVQRDLRVPMADGAELLADLYTPEDAAAMPTVLVRTPYGGAAATGCSTGSSMRSAACRCWSRASAARSARAASSPPSTSARTGSPRWSGSCSSRGTRARSGWPGPSYLGLTQWAAADSERLGAIVPTVTATQFHGATYGGGFALESMASWHAMVSVQEKPLAGLADARQPRAAALRPAAARRRARRAERALPPRARGDRRRAIPTGGRATTRGRWPASRRRCC